MEKLKAYDLVFNNLKLGVHEFNYHINSDFFDLKEHSLYQDGSIEVNVSFHKKESLYECICNFNGFLKVNCDRCLDILNFPLNFTETLVCKLVETKKESEEFDIIYIGRNDISLNLYDFLYESVCVQLPMVRYCENDISGSKVCDPSVLDKLNTITTSNELQNPEWESIKQKINN